MINVKVKEGYYLCLNLLTKQAKREGINNIIKDQIILMAKCPHCKVNFGNTPYAEKLDVAELSRDTAIFYYPNPDCKCFQALEREEEEEEKGEECLLESDKEEIKKR